MTNFKEIAAVTVSLLWIAGSFLSPMLFSPGNQSSIVAAQPVPATTTTVATSTPQETPVHIRVPSVGIDTTITNGYYNQLTGQWTLSETSAFYATPTHPISTDNGNTLIYGHNSDKIFGKLRAVQPGAEAIITTDTGHTYVYTYTATQAVNPTDVTVLNYNASPRVMLQTCSGIWNEHRQMYSFDLKSHS